MSQQLNIKHDHFLYRKNNMEQATVCTTLVWPNWLRTNSQIKKQKQHIVNMKRGHSFKYKAVKINWFHLPYDNSQRLSK